MKPQPFDDFFRNATGTNPFPFQRSFAEGPVLPHLVHVPTGLGKTAQAVVGWLWRRFAASEALKASTPRRLVYCLPMRVLVEQTRESALDWLDAAGLLAGRVQREPDAASVRGRVKGETYRWDSGVSNGVGVHVLMGGEDAESWDIHPEREAILIGTQDMLVSRALNRGYASSRSRWPMQFGLLNTDCLWVFDEIQLMGAALATSAQLEAFRRLLPHGDSEQAKTAHGSHSVWMSATMQRDWLETVDFAPFLKDALELRFDFEEEINVEGLDQRARQSLIDRWTASKPLAKSKAAMGEADELAKEILARHRPATRTIVVVNTVRRACELYAAISVQWRNGDDGRLVLLHSRFRPSDREDASARALEIPPALGTIVVSTQVIEAGVDVSATTLFTELAPWASLVQRFGRCNRRGENSDARVFWIDLAGKSGESKNLARPYEPADLRVSAGKLTELRDVGLQSLPVVRLSYEHIHVIRRKDLIDLFDTTPDLAGNDIDIDRFVRDTEQTDVRAFWREWDGDTPPNDPTWRRVSRDELCSAPIGSKQTPGFDDFARKNRGKVWRWDSLSGEWHRPAVIFPGQVYLVHVSVGGYSPQLGWGYNGNIDVIGPVQVSSLCDDEYNDDGLSKTDRWQTIDEHTDAVCKEMEGLLAVSASSFTDLECTTLRAAARWHDWGKAHEKFQIKIDDGQELMGSGSSKLVSRREQRPTQWAQCRIVAKAPGEQRDREGTVAHPGFWSRIGFRDGGRRYFRHELASALGVLQVPHESLRSLNREGLDLIAYLVAAHHGKVRLSIRSLPNETRPHDETERPLGDCRFARGVWEGDKLPGTNLGSGVKTPALTLSLEPMELGVCEEEPFVGQASWLDRMIHLREELGPFRLAFLEAVLRAADMRASDKAAAR